MESCIGVGEVAISDHRSSAPTPHELARLARCAAVRAAYRNICRRYLDGLHRLSHVACGKPSPICSYPLYTRSQRNILHVPPPDQACLSCSEARVGGMIGGKCGLVHVHVGTGPTRLAPLRDALAASDVPISQFLPTHMERSEALVDEGLEWLRAGGSIDFTAGKDVRFFSYMLQVSLFLLSVPTPWS